MPRLRFESVGADTVAADLEKINGKQREQLKTQEDIRRAALEFDRTVRGINRRNETEQERYNRLLMETKQALDAKRISAKTAATEVNRINREMRDGVGRFRQYRTAQRSAFGPAALQSLTRYAAGLASIHTVATLVTGELRQQAELREKAATTKFEIASAREVLLQNLPQQDAQRAINRLTELVSTLQIPERFVDPALSQAISASGGNIPAAFRATELALRFNRANPQAAGLFAGSLLDISQVTGTLDAQANLGFLSTVGREGRVVGARQQAQNIPQALIGMMQAGMTPQQAAATFIRLGVGGADFTGAITGTGGISFAQQIRDFQLETPEVDKTASKVERLTENLASAQERLADTNRSLSQAAEIQAAEEASRALAPRPEFETPEQKQRRMAREQLEETRKRIQADNNQKRLQEDQQAVEDSRRNLEAAQAELAKQREAVSAIETKNKAFAGADTNQKLRMLVQDPALLDAFLEDSSFEKKVQGPIQALLTPSGLQAFEAVQGRVPFGVQALSEAGAAQLSQVESMMLNPGLRQTRLRGFFETRAQGRRLRTPTLLAQDDIEFLREELAATGQLATLGRIQTALADAGGGISPDEAISILQQRADFLRQPRAIAQGVGAQPSMAQPSPENLATAREMEKLIMALLDLKNTIQNQDRRENGLQTVNE